MVRWTIIRVYKQINGKVPSITWLEAQKPSSWNYFAISHGKGIVDGIGGKAKALVLAKVMSIGDDRIIDQSSKDFQKQQSSY